MEDIEKEFVRSLAGGSKSAEAYEAHEDRRRNAVDDAMAALTPELKQQIREGMTFSISDSKVGLGKKPKGLKEEMSAYVKNHLLAAKEVATRPKTDSLGDNLEKTIDTEDAVAKGHGIKGKDQARVQKAMDVIVRITRSVIEKEGADGSPLFTDPREIAEEVFTPLVREGLVPENFVVEQYSEVQMLIDATIAQYRQANKDAGDKKVEKEAKLLMNASGAVSDTLDQLKAKAELTKKDTVARAKGGFGGSEVYTEQERRKDYKKNEGRIGKAKLNFTYAAFMAYKGVAAWGKPAPDGSGDSRALYQQKVMLDPSHAVFIEPRSNDPAINAANAERKAEFDRTKGQPDQDQARLQCAQIQKEAKIQTKFAALGLPPSTAQLYIDALALKASDPVFYGKTGVKALKSAIKGAKAIHASAEDIAAANAQLKAALDEALSRGAVRGAIKQLDAALVALADESSPGLGVLFAGRYAGALKDSTAIDAAAKAASGKTKDASKLVKLFTAAFEQAFIAAAPEEHAATFAGVGGKVAKAVGSAVKANQVGAAIEQKATDGYAQLVRQARAAIPAQLKPLQDLAGDQTMKVAIDDRAEARATAIGDAIVAALDPVLGNAVAAAASPDLGSLFTGLYAASVDKADLGEAVVESLKGDVDASRRIAQVLADGFEMAFVKAAPDKQDSTFADLGQAAAAAIKKAVPRAELTKDKIEGARKSLVAPVQSALYGVLAGSAALKLLLTDANSLKKLTAAVAFADEEALVEQLRENDEEIQEYERQLVMVDEGGAMGADQKTIEKLITRIQKDREVLAMVLQVSGLITSVVGAGGSVAARASAELTDVVVGEVLGPLRAAQLVVQLSVSIVQAAEHRRLMNIFKENLKRSRRAVSGLSSVVQGFLSSKTEQLANDVIKECLLVAQIAAEIIGSVPEPMTMAVGKTMKGITKAAELGHVYAATVYDENQLAAGWKATIEAINSPKNRVAGLKALRMNPTMGMHAVAWAAMTKQPPDPVARMIANSVGLDEQTLAAGGTEKKVLQYLQTLLADDRELMDPTLLKVNWAPEDIALKGIDWCKILRRAERDAVPELRAGQGSEVLRALSKTDQHDLDALAQQKKDGTLDATLVDRYDSETKDVVKALKQFKPQTKDGGVHTDVALLVTQFQQLAKARLVELDGLAQPP